MTKAAPRSNDETPLGWTSGALKDVATLTRGMSWRKAEESSDGVPVVTIPNIRNGVVDFDVAYRLSRDIPAEKLLLTGDILLVGSSGSIENVGRAATVPTSPFDAVTFASFLIRALPIAGKMTAQFLGHLLTGNVIDFRKVARRAADGKWNLQVEELKNYPVAYPTDLVEQDAICQTLAKVTHARDSHQALAEAIETVFRSLRDELMTGRRRVKEHGEAVH